MEVNTGLLIFPKNNSRYIKSDRLRTKNLSASAARSIKKIQTTPFNNPMLLFYSSEIDFIEIKFHDSKNEF